jgi:hypothetical protein
MTTFIGWSSLSTGLRYSSNVVPQHKEKISVDARVGIKTDGIAVLDVVIYVVGVARINHGVDEKKLTDVLTSSIDMVGYCAGSHASCSRVKRVVGALADDNLGILVGAGGGSSL